jgi:hypothetical protein
MGVLEVAFALKLTQGNRVGLAAPGKSPLPSRADDVRAATAEQQQITPLRRAHPIPIEREQRENRASEALSAAESGLSPRELRQMRAIKAATALAAAEAPAVPAN